MRLCTAVHKSGYCSIPISAPICPFSQSLSHMLYHALVYAAQMIGPSVDCSSLAPLSTEHTIVHLQALRHEISWRIPKYCNKIHPFHYVLSTAAFREALPHSAHDCAARMMRGVERVAPMSTTKFVENFSAAILTGFTLCSSLLSVALNRSIKVCTMPPYRNSHMMFSF